MIYIRNETANILEIFDNVLVENGIIVPSSEDDDRGEDNEAALYGSVYWTLFERLENALFDIVKKVKAGEEIVIWDQPIPDDMQDLVAKYCTNDVEATEAVLKHLKKNGS
jgi:hypothetical protein